ncbi:Outer membrane protein assembly complex, YaeT protein [Verrucomicrobia bacterium]|nr:Outer membrane protein assembly complex, YaeT protein [Verrucomicrobiota bacterium]
MKLLLRLCGLFMLCALLPAARGQFAPYSSAKIAKIEIRHIGPPAVSDEFVRANIRVKVGDPYLPSAVNDDVVHLYSTGFFYNIQTAIQETPEGIVLTYALQGNPRVTEIKFQGNTRYSDAKLRKKITSKPGEPLNEVKLFTDAEEIKKMYQKAGYPRTDVHYVLNLDENAGRATVTFQISESYKIKIIEVDFVGAAAFKQKNLRHQIKTRKHWMFSWLTGHGFLKDEDFEEDKEKLAEYYRDHGYIDFELKDVQFLNPTPRTMVIRLIVYEGTQYKVGAIKFTGNKLFDTNAIANGIHALPNAGSYRGKLGPNGLAMDVGDVFTAKGLGTNIDQIEDFYGAKGYIDVNTSTRNLNVQRIPNTERGTMDLEFQIEEGQKSYIEKIDIKGNTKTKDTVIRRELAVSPGEVFDMVRVKVSKTRLEGLQYFEKVDTRAEPTDVLNHKDLVVGVDEKNTGNFTLGAGFSSVDSLVGFAEISQGNFDLFNPPTFTGGGQKFRLRVSLGLLQQQYVASFIEPWFLGKKLSLGVDLYYRELDYQSLYNEYDEVRAGGSVSLTRALGSDFLIGSLRYTLEDVGILLNPGFYGWRHIASTGPGGPFGGPTGPTGAQPGPPSQLVPPNVPNAILDETGWHVLSRVGASLAYDTRRGGVLPNKGQRTELTAEFVGGPLGFDKEFYKLDLHSGWYFRGFAKGHVLELAGRAGVAESLISGDVPFYERWYLGGLYSLRGFKYRSVSPRQFPPFTEPIGGDTYWFGTAEYSIPIFEQPHGVGVRFAMFYDIGNVLTDPYNFSLKNFDDNWGLGIRLNLPIGPLRLDYGIPINHDPYNSGSGQFQFGVGYTREF